MTYRREPTTPFGLFTLYMKGERASYNGSVFKSKADNNRGNTPHVCRLFWDKIEEAKQ